MLLYANFPSWLHPEIIPGVLPVRWYGLMYIIAFGVAFVLFRRQVKERNFPMSEDHLTGMFGCGILGLLLGARLFSTLVYSPPEAYLFKPWLIFWPFTERGQFTGFMGMSYHGGVVGCLLGVVLYCRKKQINIREVCDMLVASIPLGYTFGRLGNFANAELYGRATTSPMGMLFPNAEPLPLSEPWVRESAEQLGIATRRMVEVNLPRFPSQLYEAFFEGIVLWAIIWIFRNRKPVKGFLVSLYLMGYGLFRFFIEYFREPDKDLGYRIEFVKSTLSPSIAHPPLSFSTGQLFCFGMIVCGIVWLIIVSRMQDKDVVRVYADEGDDKPEPIDPAEKDNERKRLRKLRKKLR